MSHIQFPKKYTAKYKDNGNFHTSCDTSMFIGIPHSMLYPSIIMSTSPTYNLTMCSYMHNEKEENEQDKRKKLSFATFIILTALFFLSST